MPRTLTTKTPEEKRQARKMMLWGGLSWVISCPILFFAFRENFDNTWTPSGAVQYIAGALVAILLLLGIVFVFGLRTLLDDAEVRAAKGSSRVDTSLSDWIVLLAIIPVIFAGVFLVRYVYLLIGYIGLLLIGTLGPIIFLVAVAKFGTTVKEDS